MRKPITCTVYNRFRLLRKRNLPDVYGGSLMYEFEHLPTGATYIHIENNDTENTFAVGFKTVPKDSTGIAHILEHTVLSGSRKYPVKDPFFSMINRSLSTFMNAFTASDWTLYPFSSENKKDYYNLMSVYLDAVFFPKIDRLSFLQEGWRFDLEKDRKSNKEKLVYKGVVYNEMKGSMSSVSRVMAQSLLSALYPDTPYSHNSGGDPEKIVNLTHEQLVAFHKEFGFYHPSNAIFYSYGNFPFIPTLEFVGDVLRDFVKIIPDTDIPSQPRWSKPKKVEYQYSLAKTEDPIKKHQACVGWITTDISDTFEIFALDLLVEILLGNPAAPLRKALIDSKLGSALSDCSGFDVDMKEIPFVCGLKGIKKEDAEKVHQLVFDTLGDLAKNGIDKELIDAEIHQLEFHTKEISGRHYPYGLGILLQFLENSIHKCDPEDALDFSAHLTRLKKEIANGGFFETKITHHFLRNPHHVLLTLSPDPKMAEKEEARMSLNLAKIHQNMTAKELEAIRKDTKQLEDLQNSKPNLSCLPTLDVEDVPEGVKKVEPPLIVSSDKHKIRFYDQPTSGISYLTGAIGVGSLSENLMTLVPFFCYTLNKIGTTKRGYEDMVRRITACTGGISFTMQNLEHIRNNKCISIIKFSGKCLDRNTNEMLDIITELLTCFDFLNHDRLKSLLLEYCARLEPAVVNSGHHFAASLAARNISQVHHLDEICSGVSQLKFIKELIKSADMDDIAKRLAKIAQTVFRKRNIKIAVTRSTKNESLEGLTAIQIGIDRIYNAIPLKGKPDFTYKAAHQPGHWAVREGWATSSDVSFVVSVMRAPKTGQPDAPTIAVIAKLLQSTYIHREIREKGGAYGGVVTYSPNDGIFIFLSYRDPHIVNTIDIYKSALKFLNSGNFTDKEIEEAVLKVCAELGKVQTPNMATQTNFIHSLISLTDKDREAFKKGVLAVTREDIERVAAAYFQPRKEMSTAVISGQNQLEKANEKLAKIPFPHNRCLTLFEIGRD